MKFEEYQFDVTRLWASGEEDERALWPAPARVARPPRPAGADVIPFRRAQAVEAPADPGACRAGIEKELHSIATSLKPRDTARRAWIAARCSNCRACPEMAG